MSQKVWINNRVPQTLYIAQVMLYIRGAFGVLSLGSIGRYELFGSEAIFNIVILLASFGALAGAFGIANSYKWGWRLGVAAALTPFVLRLNVAVILGLGDALRYDLLGLVFDVGVLAALLHQQSAQHQRLYFR
ncbi:MAG: hypothetical protein R8F63_07675 [Acidimicrobiales bacterium]|nr:hypothetical protein [Acidimicrobiales bacterium]